MVYSGSRIPDLGQEILLFGQRLSYRSVAYATMPIGVMDSSLWCFSKNEEESMDTRAVFFNHAKTPRASITTITHNTFQHCRVRFYALKDNLSRNNCIVLELTQSVNKTI